MSRVALYGGAFDPPHLAHLFAITWLLGRPDLDEVWVVPTADHVFGKQMAPFDARCQMLETALQIFGAGASVCRFEAERSGPSRTFDTLTLLSARYPEHSFGLVIGADNLTERHRWHRFDDLVARWPVWVLDRPGHGAALAALRDAPWCRPGPMLPDVSSTALRAALGGQGDPAALAWLPGGLLAQAQALYRHNSSAEHPTVAVLGHGRAGAALAAALRAARWPVWTWNRSPGLGADFDGPLPSVLAEADIWLLAVSDDALAAFSRQLAALPWADDSRAVLHCAGRLDASVLAPLAARGVRTGPLHPLQSLRGAPSAGALRGAWCACEGAAAEDAEAVVRAFGGRPVRLPAGEKAAYHAAAVFSANFITTLGAGGVALLEALGISEVTARAMLVPLLRGTVQHLAHTPVTEALTGPFARGDLAAVEAHCAALGAHAPTFLAAYQVLARTTAEWLGWPDAQRQALERVLTGL